MYHLSCLDPNCKKDLKFCRTNDPVLILVYAREHADTHVDPVTGHGFDCLIYSNSDIVGNVVDGVTGRIPEADPPYDMATATGMYDRY